MKHGVLIRFCNKTLLFFINPLEVDNILATFFKTQKIYVRTTFLQLANSFFFKNEFVYFGIQIPNTECKRGKRNLFFCDNNLTLC